MKREEKLLSAMGHLEEQYLMEAQNYEKNRKDGVKMTHKSKKLRLRRIPLAAAIMVLFAVAAGAAGITMHQRAQRDLGITDLAQVPEYTEYSLVEEPAQIAESSEVQVTEETVEGSETEAATLPEDSPWTPGGPVQLVSTFCSGNELVAYLSVPNVTAEMQAELSQIPGWDFGGVLPTGHDFSIGVWQADYDSESETALIKVQISGDFEGMEEVQFIPAYRREQGDDYGILYDELTIPVTASECLSAQVGKTVPSEDIDMDVEVARVCVYAGYISVEVKAPSFEERNVQGADAFEATYDYFLYLDRMFTASDGDAYYGPCEGVIGADMTINMADGSGMVVAQQESTLAGWAMESNMNGVLDTGEAEFRYYFATPLSLGEVESVTIMGETYLLH